MKENKELQKITELKKYQEIFYDKLVELYTDIKIVLLVVLIV